MALASRGCHRGLVSACKEEAPAVRGRACPDLVPKDVVRAARDRVCLRLPEVKGSPLEMARDRAPECRPARALVQAHPDSPRCGDKASARAILRCQAAKDLGPECLLCLPDKDSDQDPCRRDRGLGPVCRACLRCRGWTCSASAPSAELCIR